MIWIKNYSIEDFVARNEKTAVTHCDIRCEEVGSDYIKASMPVDERTRQPLGLLHGGMSVVLAETLMSTGANWTVDFPNEFCVGLEINANHIRSAREGRVMATARPLHIGRSTQVWETRIEQDSKLVCVSRMTLSVLKRDPKSHGVRKA
jgi:1,4-dihydroxy-2-naphthoyl-CoA hydrolase